MKHMGVRDDIIDILSTPKETLINNLLDDYEELYLIEKKVKISREKTDTFYFLAEISINFFNRLLNFQRINVANQEIQSMDRPSLIANASQKGIVIGEGSYTKVNIKVPIVLNNTSSMTLYNYDNPDDLNVKQTLFTDGTNTYIIDNPKDVLNDNTDKYSITFTSSGDYNIPCRCTTKGAITPIVGTINDVVGPSSFIDTSNISNIQSSLEIEGVVINSDENGVYKYGTNIEDSESILNKILNYKTSSTKTGEIDALKQSLYDVGCSLVNIYPNQDHIEHNEVPGNMIAISVIGGNTEKIFDTIKNNTIGTTYHYYAIPNISLTKRIETENGCNYIAINRPSNIPVDITLYTNNDITDTIKERIIEALYKKLVEDPFYKQEDIVKIQAIRTYLETILYQSKLDYTFPTIKFTNYPDKDTLKGDLKYLYFYEKSVIHIVKI